MVSSSGLGWVGSEKRALLRAKGMINGTYCSEHVGNPAFHGLWVHHNRRKGRTAICTEECWFRLSSTCTTYKVLVIVVCVLGKL